MLYARILNYMITLIAFALEDFYRTLFLYLFTFIYLFL